MKFKNIPGTANRVAPTGYKSFLDYYMKRNGLSSTPKCVSKSCNEQAEVGAHVWRVCDDIPDWQEYIIPLCNACNAIKSDFEVDDGVKPVVVHKML